MKNLAVNTLMATAVATAPAIAQAPQSLEALLCGHTIHAFYGNAGNQIEYLAANGNSYFWRAGEDQVIEGRWRIATALNGAESICFDYEQDALNPNTSGNEFCLPGGWFLSTFLEGGIRIGDPYDLASGATPFVMSPIPEIDVAALAATFPDPVEATGCAELLSS